MIVTVCCPHPGCGKEYRVDESQLGRTVVCSACHREFALSASDGETLRPVAESDTGGAPPPLPPRSAEDDSPKSLGRFEIRGRLGSGTFGAVYRAHDPVLDREVALKVPRAAVLAKSEARARFLREPKAAAQLRHPHIVPVFDAGTDGDQYYIASAYIEGRTLEEIIAEDRPDFGRAARIVRDLAEALAYAHDMGVVHRDVKPANIMIDSRGDALLMDFGLAHLESAEDKLTHDGSVMGTPAYMAPEQADRKFGEVGPRADQYSLGVVLYELLCGDPPFSGPPSVVIFNVVNQEPPPPRRVNSAVPRDLETICLKAMAKEPEKRYATCAELAEDLRRWLADEPIGARRIGPVERLVRWSRRNPALASLSITVLFLLLLVAVTTSVGYVRTSLAVQTAERERQRAEDERQRAEDERQQAEDARRQAQDALETVVKAQRERIIAQVDGLLKAEIAQVPQIVESLRPYSKEVLKRFEDVTRRPDLSDEERLRLSIAMLSEDQTLVPYLRDRLLVAEPGQLLVLRAVLLPYHEQLSGDLWKTLEDENSEKQRHFRAACALAAWDPESPLWAGASKQVVAVLVAESPLVIGYWTEALRPVRDVLLSPLRDVWRAGDRPESERVVAATILGEYAADRPDVLVELVKESDPKQFAVMMPKLKAHGVRAVPLLTAELTIPIPDGASQGIVDGFAGRIANSAVALLQMDKPAEVWPLLKHSPDPTVRTFLIHRLGPAGTDPAPIVRQLEKEKEASIRRALILCLGEFSEDALPAAKREALTPRFLETYRDDPDPGIHGAAEWLLRKWGQKAQMEQVDGRLATGKVEGNRGWYVNTQGDTMIVLSRPVELLIGSPTTEADRNANEQQRRVKIDNAFAIAAKEVTIEKFARFLKDSSRLAGTLDSRDLETEKGRPVLFVFGAGLDQLAKKYCNWLSLKDGLPEDQWCYLPGDPNNSMKLAPDFLNRSGYRLPTEVEWEYACRAGTTTRYHWGQAERFLPKYAWYAGNAAYSNWPVGTLKPNDLGLFDVQGNMWEWCYRFAPFPEQPPPGHVFKDIVDSRVFDASSVEGFMLRGGSFLDKPHLLRSAVRYEFQSLFRYHATGLRVARTHR